MSITEMQRTRTKIAEPAEIPRSTLIQMRISAVASRRRNLITTAELLEAGLSRSAISRWVASGRLVRIHPGVYAVGSAWLDDDARSLAAVLAAGPGAALDSSSALDVWDFTRFRSRRISISAPRQRRRRVAGAEVRQSRAAHVGHVREVRGIPVTSVPWTILELGCELPVEQLCHVIHQARMRRLLDLDELRDLVAAYLTRPGHGVVVAALDAYDAGSAGTRSFLEDRFLVIARRVLGRIPLVNVHVTAGNEEFEVDLPLLRFGNLCIEVDGPLHDEPNQQRKDRIRDAALRAAGYRVVRFHWRDIERRPEWCEQRLRKAIAAPYSMGR